MTLADLNQKKQQKTNQPESLKARIEGFHGDALLVERLKEMGLHQGLEVTAVGRAPFGGPLLFRFGNTVLALRLEEAQCALIQTLI
jgi:ferrous iron transport protein A